MEKQFLVTGSPSKLTVDMAFECLTKRQAVILTLEPGTEAPVIPSGLGDRLTYAEWNRRSPISARFVLLQAMNRQVQIDHAIVVYTPKNDRIVFHEANAAYFEERLDYDLKGYLFLVKELIAYFLKQGHGSLTFVLHNSNPDSQSPMDALMCSAMEGFVESLFQQYAQEPITLRCLDSKAAQSKQVTETVLNMVLEDNPKTKNRTTRLGAKMNFFNFGTK